MWVIKEKTGKNRKNRQNPDFHCLFFGQPSNWVTLLFFKSDGLLVSLCHKFNLTSPQQGHRGSLLVIARAMSTRSVEIESGTWRWTLPAAAREVTFG